MHGWQAGSFHYTVCPPTIVILTNFMFWCMKYKYDFLSANGGV